MGYQPVRSHIDTHLDGYGEGQGIKHSILDNGTHLLFFWPIAVEDQFVVNL